MSELSLTSSLRNAAARAIRALEQEARHAWGREAAERIRALEAPSDGHRAHHLRRADAAGRHELRHAYQFDFLGGDVDAYWRSYRAPGGAWMELEAKRAERQHELLPLTNRRRII